MQAHVLPALSFYSISFCQQYKDTLNNPVVKLNLFTQEPMSVTDLQPLKSGLNVCSECFVGLASIV